MITVKETKIHEIYNKHPEFLISDGLRISPRAGFKLSHNCPQHYRQIIASCIDNGWLEPVAYLSEQELIFNGLKR